MGDAEDLRCWPPLIRVHGHEIGHSDLCAIDYALCVTPLVRGRSAGSKTLWLLRAKRWASTKQRMRSIQKSELNDNTFGANSSDDEIYKAISIRSPNGRVIQCYVHWLSNRSAQLDIVVGNKRSMVVRGRFGTDLPPLEARAQDVFGFRGQRLKSGN
ncbi:hypothetical protein FOL47_001431 [Perkinsus chesapeaki]|uniref:Uncharacterized protein n=1 Tax=Perkinsus chesapeaki TaxID=330153 RepID=A0A7J6KSH5_PERCH|nr:hypothetical protein FOL47_001431 [Perkinsus chesapeaki]